MAHECLEGESREAPYRLVGALPDGLGELCETLGLEHRVAPREGHVGKGVGLDHLHDLFGGHRVSGAYVPRLRVVASRARIGASRTIDGGAESRPIHHRVFHDGEDREWRHVAFSVCCSPKSGQRCFPAMSGRGVAPGHDSFTVICFHPIVFVLKILVPSSSSFHSLIPRLSVLCLLPYFRVIISCSMTFRFAISWLNISLPSLRGGVGGEAIIVCAPRGLSVRRACRGSSGRWFPRDIP